jgi:hypothetical protein
VLAPSDCSNNAQLRVLATAAPGGPSSTLSQLQFPLRALLPARLTCLLLLPCMLPCRFHWNHFSSCLAQQSVQCCCRRAWRSCLSVRCCCLSPRYCCQSACRCSNCGALVQAVVKATGCLPNARLCRCHAHQVTAPVLGCGGLAGPGQLLIAILQFLTLLPLSVKISMLDTRDICKGQI